MHKTAVLFALIFLMACASREPQVTETPTAKPPAPLSTNAPHVAVSVPPTRASTTNDTAPPQDLQVALTQPINNVGDLPLWFLPGTDQFGFVFITEHDARIRMRIQISDRQGFVLADSTQEVLIFKPVGNQLVGSTMIVPIEHAYEIPPGQRRDFIVRARVLKQDYAGTLSFRLVLGGFQLSKPKPDKNGNIPSLPRDGDSGVTTEPVSPRSNDDVRGMREF